MAALFLALGGAAYAGSKVRSGDIAKNAVKAKHIRADAVRSSEIKQDSVGPAELRGFETAEVVTEFIDLDTTTVADSEGVTLVESPDGSLNLRAQCIWVQGDNEITADLTIGTDRADVQLAGGGGADSPDGFESVDPTGNGKVLTTLDEPLGTFHQRNASFAALTPSGTVLQGTYHMAVNDDPSGQDCTFSIVAFG